MQKNTLLLNLQKKYKQGGYALVSPESGKVWLYADTVKNLYKTIEMKDIPDADKLVMYIPQRKGSHVFSFSLSIRIR